MCALNHSQSIILASKSPRRREILERFGFSVDVRIPQGIREVNLGESGMDTPEKVVQENAIRKADFVSSGELCVLASDTIVMLDGVQYGKPDSREQAFRFLTDLSGKTHQVFSSFCLKHRNRQQMGWDVSRVSFKSLDSTQIMDYMEKVHVMDKAGAYAIQDGGESIIARLEGSFYTVMGLPIEKILSVLQQWEYPIPPCNGARDTF